MAVNKRKILETAQKFLQKGALDRAAKEYRTLLDADPRDTGVRLKLGDIHLRLGEKDEAVGCYLKVAQQFMKDGFDAKAVALYRQIGKLAPEQYEIHVPLAELYQRLGLTAEAMSALQQATEAFQKAGRKRESLEILRKMAALDPTNTTSRLKIADLLRQQDLRDEALAEYDEVAVELERTGETEALAGVLERILELEPERTSALIGLARVCLEQDAPRAGELASRALGREPDQVEAHEILAQALQVQGLEDALEPLHRRLAELYRARGEEGRAREIVQRYVANFDLTLPGGDALSSAPGGFAATPGDEPEVLEEVGSGMPSEPPAGEADSPFERTLDPESLLSLDLPETLPGSEPARDDAVPLASPEEVVVPAEASRATGAAPTRALEIETSLAAAAEIELPVDAPPEPAPSSPAVEGGAEPLLAEAGVYLRFGKLDRAVASLEAALRASPDHLVALEKLAGALEQQGQAGRAAEVLARAVTVARSRRDADTAERLHARLAQLDAAAAEQLGAPAPEAETVLPPEPADTPLATGGAEAADDASRPIGEPELEFDVELDLGAALETDVAPEEAAEDGRDEEPAFAVWAGPTEPGPETPEERADDPDGLRDMTLPPELPALDTGLRDDEEAGGAEPELPLIEVEADLAITPTGPAVLSSARADAAFAPGDDGVRGRDAAEPGSDDDTQTPAAIRADDPVHPPASAGTRRPAAAPPAVTDGGTTPSGSPKRILEDLEEADFYFQQGLLDEAEAVYRGILALAPTNPQAQLRLGEIAAARGQDPGGRDDAFGEDDAGDAAAEAVGADATLAATLGDDLAHWDETAVVRGPEGFDDAGSLPAPELDPAGELESATETLLAAPTRGGAETAQGLLRESGLEETGSAPFDLAAELSSALHLDDTAASSPPAAATSPSDESLESLFQEFKRGVSRTLTPADHEAHYDLGIAYREMGLLEDAMAEFQVALGMPSRRVDCLQLLALCASELKRPHDAVAFLRQALADDGLQPAQRAALHHDLGIALAETGARSEALAAFETVERLEPARPGLAERLAALRADTGHTEAPATPAEVYESFDDLIADAEAALAQGAAPGDAGTDVSARAPDTASDPSRASGEAGSVTPPPAPESGAGPDDDPRRPPPGAPPRRRRISFG